MPEKVAQPLLPTVTHSHPNNVLLALGGQAAKTKLKQQVEIALK